jgi:hypothetical protein
LGKAFWQRSAGDPKIQNRSYAFFSGAAVAIMLITLPADSQVAAGFRPFG